MTAKSNLSSSAAHRVARWFRTRRADRRGRTTRFPYDPRIRMTTIPFEETPAPWFPDPTTRDDSWAERGESPFSWASRSTVPRASASRDFLNHNLAALPSEAQATFYAALRTRWPSAFFELVVARCLQQLGASLIVEPEGISGSRIDFEARFSDATIMVEATSPITDAKIGDMLRQRNPLLDIIECSLPEGWGGRHLGASRTRIERFQGQV